MTVRNKPDELKRYQDPKDTDQELDTTDDSEGSDEEEEDDD